MKCVIRVCSLLLLALAGASELQAISPVCPLPSVKASWPTTNPVWEFCYLRPSQSSATQGSSLELRDVYYNGRMVLKRAHSPILFAEYTSGTCYRDWKDDDADFLAPPSVRNMVGVPTFAVKTNCDVSSLPTASYGACPFSQGNPPGDCFTGVALEDRGNYLTVTTQHAAAWYQYASRFIFHLDGSFEPEFGFGNSDGTNNHITHWHHNYWRLDFDIEGSANDVISENNVVQGLEFATKRCNAGTTPSCSTERQWTVTDTVTGRGYRILPSAEDYVTPTNQAGSARHQIDFIGATYIAGEYGDHANNQLSDCVFAHANLSNGGDLDGAAGAGTDVVVYYRSGVRDRTNEGAGTQDSMVCKKAGPVIAPIGDWSETAAFLNGFE